MLEGFSVLFHSKAGQKTAADVDFAHVRKYNERVITENYQRRDIRGYFKSREFLYVQEKTT